MVSINPMWGTVFNFLLGVGGLVESTGLSNVLTTSGGKAGAIAATTIAFGNMFLHSFSSTMPGPLADGGPPRAGTTNTLPPRSFG
jgi:hypothetical protein